MALGFTRDFLIIQDELSDTDLDTRIRVEVIADEDTIRVDVGSSITGYPAIPDVLLISAAQFTLDLGAADVAATAGAPISFKAGDGNTTGDGGDITFEAGVSAGGSAGAVILPDQVAPAVTTNKLYAVAGNIFWNGLDLADMAIGDVVKVGTPVNNEIGVWTGDGTLEGDPNFTWDGSHLVLPSLNDAVTPTLAFGDGDTGFYELADDVLNISVVGTARFQFTANQFQAVTGAGGAIYNETASATNPTLLPNKGGTSTGIGAVDGNSLSIISAAIEAKRYTHLSSFILEAAPTPQTGLTAFATGGQASATQILSSFATITTCATGGDSVKLPLIMAIGTHMTIKNDGAAACDVFPGLGNDLGAGIDTAVSIAAGAAVIFLATVADATWTQIL